MYKIQELLNNEIYKKVKDYSKNRGDLTTYYNVGKSLFDAQVGEKRVKYGDSLIKEYSIKLRKKLIKNIVTEHYLELNSFIFCLAMKKCRQCRHN